MPPELAAAPPPRHPRGCGRRQPSEGPARGSGVRSGVDGWMDRWMDGWTDMSPKDSGPPALEVTWTGALGSTVPLACCHDIILDQPRNYNSSPPLLALPWLNDFFLIFFIFCLHHHHFLIPLHRYAQSLRVQEAAACV